MSSKIAVIGTGYVGLTTGACLRHLGHEVVCADIVPEKVEQLSRGEVPILEAGLDELVREGLAVRATCRFVLGRRGRGRRRRVHLPVRAHAPGRRRLGRPQLHRGGRPRDRPAPRSPRPIVINKSTVPVGSTRVVEQALGRSDVFVVSNPEFLREGSAVHDFLNPDRVVIGADDQAAAIRVAALYLGPRRAAHGHRPGLGRDHQVRVQRVPRHQDQLRQRHRRGVRGGRRRRERRRARHGLRQAHRPRVPAARARAGAAAASRRTPARWCASPRTPATTSTCSRASSPSTRSSSSGWPTRSSAVAGGSLDGVTRRRVGPHVQGPHRRPPRLARRSRSSAACASGARVIQAYDPAVEPGDTDPSSRASRSCADPYAACEGAEVLAVLTEWDEFKWLDFDKVAETMAQPAGRRRPQPPRPRPRCARRGFEYEGIGRA